MVNNKSINYEILMDEQYKKDLTHYPLKRYGDPVEIAHGTIHVLSDASSWVTGHSL